MIKVLFTTHPMINEKLGEGEAFQGTMKIDGTADRKQRCARFDGVGRAGIRLMDDDWFFRMQSIESANHAYVQVGHNMVEVKFSLVASSFPRLEVGKYYHVTKTATVSGHSYKSGDVVKVIGQEPEGYVGELVYRVKSVNTDRIGWAGVAHGLELV